MAITANPDFDPGFVNAPGKGQSPANPLGSVFIKSLGVVSDLSVYQNIFAGSTVNAAAGYTLGIDNFFSPEGFQMSPPGNFKSDVSLEKDVEIGGNLYVIKDVKIDGNILMQEETFKPIVINTISGPHLVLAAY